MPKKGRLLVIDAEACTHHEVLLFAKTRFPMDADVILNETGDDATATIRIRYVGSDYTHGGTPLGKRLEVSEFGKDGVWSPWRNAK